MAALNPAVQARLRNPGWLKCRKVRSGCLWTAPVPIPGRSATVVAPCLLCERVPRLLYKCRWRSRVTGRNRVPPGRSRNQSRVALRSRGRSPRNPQEERRIHHPGWLQWAWYRYHIEDQWPLTPVRIDCRLPGRRRTGVRLEWKMCFFGEFPEPEKPDISST